MVCIVFCWAAPSLVWLPPLSFLLFCVHYFPHLASHFSHLFPAFLLSHVLLPASDTIRITYVDMETHLSHRYDMVFLEVPGLALDHVRIFNGTSHAERVSVDNLRGTVYFFPYSLLIPSTPLPKPPLLSRSISIYLSIYLLSSFISYL